MCTNIERQVCKIIPIRRLDSYLGKAGLTKIAFKRFFVVMHFQHIEMPKAVHDSMQPTA